VFNRSFNFKSRTYLHTYQLQQSNCLYAAHRLSTSSLAYKHIIQTRLELLYITTQHPFSIW
jgi:hypothetical protein